ncbi:MAG: SDR family NAD(P)-dependent oxidoreductase [Acidiferrobacterales bacterium]
MRTVLITGASRGLGVELVKIFVEKGWMTFALVRQHSVASDLRDTWPRQCHPIVADVAADDCMEKVAQVVRKHTDQLDVLINNAGVNGRTYTVDDVTPEEVIELLQVHCLGAIRCTKAVLPQLRAATNAKVVNISSRLGSMSKSAAGDFSGRRISYSYRIAKAAQNMFTLCLGQELAKQGILVYAAHPGKLLTSMATEEADTDASVAAARLASWLEAADSRSVGHFISLEGGRLTW